MSTYFIACRENKLDEVAHGYVGGPKIYMRQGDAKRRANDFNRAYYQAKLRGPYKVDRLARYNVGRPTHELDAEDARTEQLWKENMDKGPWVVREVQLAVITYEKKVTLVG